MTAIGSGYNKSLWSVCRTVLFAFGAKSAQVVFGGNQTCSLQKISRALRMYTNIIVYCFRLNARNIIHALIERKELINY